jgi:hypothetical protein
VQRTIPRTIRQLDLVVRVYRPPLHEPFRMCAPKRRRRPSRTLHAIGHVLRLGDIQPRGNGASASAHRKTATNEEMYLTCRSDDGYSCWS